MTKLRFWGVADGLGGRSGPARHRAGGGGRRVRHRHRPGPSRPRRDVPGAGWRPRRRAGSGCGPTCSTPTSGTRRCSPASLDRFCGGRLELGIGAGHMRHEHLDAGLPFPGVAQRWAHTVEVLADIRARLSDDGHMPAPVQRPVPLMIPPWASGDCGRPRHTPISSVPPAGCRCPTNPPERSPWPTPPWWTSGSAWCARWPQRTGATPSWTCCCSGWCSTPSRSRPQPRWSGRRPACPVTFVAFDVLALAGQDLRGEPYRAGGKPLSGCLPGSVPPLALMSATRELVGAGLAARAYRRRRRGRGRQAPAARLPAPTAFLVESAHPHRRRRRCRWGDR